MKKTLSTALALFALSAAALAERSTDLRSSDTYFGKFMEPSTIKRLGPDTDIDVQLLRGIDAPAPQVKDYDESERNNRERRRLEGKNGYNG